MDDAERSMTAPDNLVLSQTLGSYCFLRCSCAGSAIFTEDITRAMLTGLCETSWST